MTVFRHTIRRNSSQRLPQTLLRTPQLWRVTPLRSLRSHRPHRIYSSLSSRPGLYRSWTVDGNLKPKLRPTSLSDTLLRLVPARHQTKRESSINPTALLTWHCPISPPLLSSSSTSTSSTTPFGFTYKRRIPVRHKIRSRHLFLGKDYLELRTVRRQRHQGPPLSHHGIKSDTDILTHVTL